MNNLKKLVLFSLTIVLLSSCGSNPITNSKKSWAPPPPPKINDASHADFTKMRVYPYTRQVYRNNRLVQEANEKKTVILIDLSEQRTKLIVGKKVAIDAPCCTGKVDKPTPTGFFRIRGKIVDKRSNLFGELYKDGKKVFGGDKRKYKKEFDKFVGYELPYWMRLTNDGIGMHSSKYIYRQPKSNGCIRLPKKEVQTIFAKTRVGTPVFVVQ